MNNFRKIDKQEYEELFRQTPFKTFFHEVEFHEFLERRFKWIKYEYYIYNESLFPIARIGNKLISLPFCEYGGPLPLKENIDLDEFNRDALNEFKNIKIKFHPYISNASSTSGISNISNISNISDISTHWIENLKGISEQELWDALRKTLRHEIKKAQEYGLKIRRCENLKELKQFYNLYVANLRRKRTIPYPWGVIQFLYKNPSSELLLAFYRGKIIAGDMFLHYGSPRFGEAGGFVHYFLSASDYEYRNFGAAHLILWEKIKSLIGKDVIFDLGATPKNSSLNVFKAGWGGREYPILQIGIKRNAENLRSSKLRNIWGLLPNWLIKILASKLIKFRL
jgi:hypothetical protein